MNCVRAASAHEDIGEQDAKERGFRPQHAITDLAMHRGIHQYGSASLTGKAQAHLGDNIHIDSIQHHYHDHVPQEEKLGVFLKSLAFSRMGWRLRNVAAASPTTCEWLLVDEKFNAWVDNERFSEHRGFLWIKGKPGSGKSTLMKKTIAWMVKKWPRQVVISYFFNARSTDELEKTPIGLYRSLVYQLLLNCQSLGVFFLAMFADKETEGQVDMWTETELQNFLIESVSSEPMPPLAVFIDALDEGFDEHIQGMVMFLEELASHATTSGVVLRICLSSRHYPHIQISQGFSIVVENQPGHGRDIETYVKRMLRLDDSYSVKELQHELLRRSQGIFLWVVLVTPMLRQVYNRGKSIAAMKQTLEQVPEGLHNLFAALLSRQPDSIGQCITLLQWVLCALEPLRASGLYAAIQQSHQELDTAAFAEVDVCIAQRYILDCSRGLVETLEEYPPPAPTHHAFDPQYHWHAHHDPKMYQDNWAALERAEPAAPNVQFIHQSVRDYLAATSHHSSQSLDSAFSLRGTSVFKVENCHAVIAESCLNCLLDLSKEAPPQFQILSRHPIAMYAAKYWSHHLKASRSEDLDGLLKLATKLLSNKPSWFRPGIGRADNAGLLTWVQLFDIDNPGHTARPRSSDHDIGGPIYYAVMINAPLLVSALLFEGCDLDSQGGKYGNALQAASFHGHHEIVKILLNAGANPMASTHQFRNALHAASERCHKKTVQLLLEVMFNTYVRTHYNPNRELIYASSSGHEQVVKMLLAAGADVNTWWVRSPLIAAASTGRDRIVQILLDAGADVNGGRATYCALTEAVYESHEKTVELLLSAGATISEPKFDTAIEQIIRTASGVGDRHYKIVFLLLDASPKEKEHLQYTLNQAIWYHQLELAKLLVGRGADVNQAQKPYWRPTSAHVGVLSAARYFRSRRMLDFLLESGARPEPDELTLTMEESAKWENGINWRHVGKMMPGYQESHECPFPSCRRPTTDHRSYREGSGKSVQEIALAPQTTHGVEQPKIRDGWSQEQKRNARRWWHSRSRWTQ